MTRTALKLDKENVQKAKALAALEKMTLSDWVDKVILEKIKTNVKSGDVLKSFRGELCRTIRGKKK